MGFSPCRRNKGKIWEATCWPPVSGSRSVWVAIDIIHGGLSLVQRGTPTDFPILRSQGGVRMTPPLSLRCMAQTYPYEGLISIQIRVPVLLMVCGFLQRSTDQAMLSMGYCSILRITLIYTLKPPISSFHNAYIAIMFYNERSIMIRRYLVQELWKKNHDLADSDDVIKVVTSLWRHHTDRGGITLGSS